MYDLLKIVHVGNRRRGLAAAKNLSSGLYKIRNGQIIYFMNNISFEL